MIHYQVSTTVISSSFKKSGFTIVELLIVIVVIGALAAIMVVAYIGIQERANVARANTDLDILVKSIQLARLSSNSTIMGVTGNGCTRCSGTQAAYELSLDKISAASGTNLNPLKSGDFWGANYVLDENEGEQIANPCICDSLTISIIHAELMATSIPFYNCPNYWAVDYYDCRQLLMVYN